MSEAAQSISYFDLIYILIPVLIVIYIFFKWKLKFSTVIYAHVRMFIQLIIIGYCLKYIFNNNHPAIILLILTVMIVIAGYIAPRPLGGMIFANCMNSISLAAERFENEKVRERAYEDRRNKSFKASLIPITNSLLAVGLVSLPGTMTGMILSGISPMIAVKYQIMVMCMIFGSTGISSAIYLVLMQDRET